MYTPEKEYNLRELLEKADNGDLEAMSTCVSLLAAEGYISDPEDRDIMERYVSYLQKLAENGKNWPYIMLGDAYRDGTGVAVDPQEAIRCYEKAAEAGIGMGNECIGMMYFEGTSVPQDYKKAFEYFTKDSKKKSPCTIYSLGEMYRCGSYVEKDLEKACEYYKEIIYGDMSYVTMDAYYKLTLFRLGYALHHGLGVECDLDEAMELISESKKLHDMVTGDDAIVIPADELMQEWVEINRDMGRL